MGGGGAWEINFSNLHAAFVGRDDSARRFLGKTPQKRAARRGRRALHRAKLISAAGRGKFLRRPLTNPSPVV